MAFIDEVKALAETSLDLKDELQTEEAVRHSLVMPFLNLLGYNVFNPKEVVPEYIADVGTKKGEKVDYAILHEGEPHIIIEIKGPGSKLKEHFNQLYRYFNALRKAKFAILTNGILFQFFSDLDETNILDNKPFLTINLEDLKEPAVTELERFHKKNYDKDLILSTASDLKYTTQFKEYLSKQFKQPDEEFIKFLLRNVYSGKLMSSVVERFEPIIKKSMSIFINELVSDKIKFALEGVKPEAVIIEEKKEAPSVAETIEPEGKKREIVTTEEELEAYVMIKYLLKDTLGEEHTVSYKDTLSYFTVLLDNNVRNWICRLWLEGRNHYIQLYGEDRVEIESLQDIEELKDKLIETALNFMKDNTLTFLGDPKWYKLPELIKANTTGAKPQKVKLPNNEIVKVKKWPDIIEAVAKWLYDNKKLSAKHCPIPDYSGKNRYCVNTESVHPTGKQYKNILSVGDLCMETNYSSKNQLKNIREILTTVGEKSDIFHIYV